MPSVIALMSVPFRSATVNCRYARAAQVNSMRPRSRCSFSPSSAQGKAECPVGNSVHHYYCFSLPLELTAVIPIFICSNKPPVALSIIFPTFIFQITHYACSQAVAWASRWLPSFTRPSTNRLERIRPQPALDWKKLGILIGIILLIDFAVLTESPIILYPIAILSVLGVLALLIMVFSMVWMLMMRQENVFTDIRQMWMPFLAGTTLAFLMISAIDLLRFKLTGTWGGFPLG